MNIDRQNVATTLRPMSRDDHSLVDGIFADAFMENDISRLIVGTGDIRSRLVRLNRMTVRSKENLGTIAEVDGRPAGAMIQGEAPKCEPSGLAGFRFMIDALLATRFRIATAGGLTRDVARNHPEWAHRHLTVLGVRPEFQGRGVGSALLKRFCDEADAAGANSYLETDSEGGKQLYERFGFREVGRTRKKSVNFIYMWRTAVGVEQPSS